MKRWLILIFGMFLIGAGIYRFGKGYLAPKEIRILETARVERGDVQAVLVATGVIKPQVGALVKIGARATGMIEKMNVRVGDHVKKGQLIALIDDREILKDIQAEKASLDEAIASYDQIERSYPERIKEAKANYEYARIDFQRQQSLLKKNYTTRDKVDLARSKLKATEAVYNRLLKEYQTQRRIAKARIDGIRARIEQLQVKLSYTRIYAPISGIVSDVTAQEGETIVTGLQVANLVSVLDPTRLELWVYVDETDIAKVAVGQKLSYYVDAYPERIFSGKIERIRPEPVTKDNIVYFLAIVKVKPEYTAYLRPEMTSYVRIVYAEKKNILTVPNKALKFEKGKQIVYLIKGPGKVEKRQVQVGLQGENRTEVIAGLEAGMKVATRLLLPETTY